jgi:tRNA pseudouridine32 synthase / 23S rRNA pseudouridine746 synthase
MNDLRDEIADGARAWHSGHMLDNRILFLDGEAIVLDKPAGLAVDAPRDGSPSLEDALDSLRFGFQRAPSAVHRLDRDTSGCLLLARNPKAHKRFSATFEAGAVKKSYVAVLEGVPGARSGRITLALSKRSMREMGWRMVPDAKKGKPATTDWELLGEVNGRALVLFRPATGRTHQLRVHAAAGIGHAIVGDPVYGTGGRAMLLHALALGVPREGKPEILAEALPPAAFDPWRMFLPAPAMPEPIDAA